jgi:hypothetical protein
MLLTKTFIVLLLLETVAFSRQSNLSAEKRTQIGMRSTNSWQRTASLGLGGHR